MILCHLNLNECKLINHHKDKYNDPFNLNLISLQIFKNLNLK